MYQSSGKSGAGKSTLLHILGTLDKPDSGKVVFEGQDVFLLKRRSRSRNSEIRRSDSYFSSIIFCRNLRP
ncbi:MAG: ATP-binding cassette domain-containing protein [Ignavibacteria bacterium]